MNFLSMQRRWLVTLILSGATLIVSGLCAKAQAPAQSPPAAQSSPQDDAAAKAAERKKKFEESRKRLEEADPPAPPSPPAQTVSPPKYGPAVTRPLGSLALTFPMVMEIGENQRFLLYTRAGENVTSRADWSVSDSSVAELRVIGGLPHLYGRSKGQTVVYGAVNGMYAQILLNVIPKEEATAATVRWSASANPGALLRIVPSIPERDSSHF